ncbi:MAG TPA: hypothetical protein PK264_16520 [Hyphomicrobiaceae bacterium]|nr:hypothetical protein [Hyphomicrobiaceae bacterium]
MLRSPVLIFVVLATALVVGRIVYLINDGPGGVRLERGKAASVAKNPRTEHRQGKLWKAFRGERSFDGIKAPCGEGSSGSLKGKRYFMVDAGDNEIHALHGVFAPLPVREIYDYIDELSR